MDIKTCDCYESGAFGFAERYENSSGGITDWFNVAFPRGSKVLDIGSGSGRDMAALLKGGWDTVGVEPVAGLREQSFQYHPELSSRVTEDSLPGLSKVHDDSFDGVLCSAVLMHIPEEELFDSVYSIRRVLRAGGRLLVSLPANIDGSPVAGRDESGRLYSGVTSGKLELILTRCGFSRIGGGQSLDSLGRSERVWVNMLFVLESGSGNRSIDRIEAVLNRDRKTATYKLALIRALAEIAVTHYNCATWMPDDRVSVPVDLVAEKWLEYYWVLFEGYLFIPQMNGEKGSGGGKSVRFRESLTTLARDWGTGGLSEFRTALHGGKLTSEMQIQLDHVLSDIRAAIVNGPIVYSKGGDDGRLFQFDRRIGGIVMSFDLWQELSLMGPWIREATILRWSELTTVPSKRVIPTGDVINLLIRDVSPLRNVSDSRSLFKGMSDLTCVWTGAPIGRRKWDVDHAIPYSLWRNNDLWNLFPATSTANNSKRDSLPTRRLVAARRKPIQKTWEMVAQKWPTRFFTEIRMFGETVCSADSAWPDHLFHAFTEALEFTALQRGVGRWEP